jgi:hypothetical protein
MTSRSERKRESDRKYRDKHRKKIRDYQSKWRAANPEKRRKLLHDWYIANRERLSLKYHAENDERIALKFAAKQKLKLERDRLRAEHLVTLRTKKCLMCGEKFHALFQQTKTCSDFCRKRRHYSIRIKSKQPRFHRRRKNPAKYWDVRREEKRKYRDQMKLAKDTYRGFLKLAGERVTPQTSMKLALPIYRELQKLTNQERN